MDRRASGRILVGSLVVAVGGIATACILADPPPSLVNPPQGDPPDIITASVVPPTLATIGGPFCFTVPVGVYDPTSTLSWALYQDEPPYSLEVQQGHTTAQPDAGSIQTIQGCVNGAISGCHRLNLYVSFSTIPELPNALLCTQCAVVSWLYDPDGGACPTWDAASFVDAADGFTPPPLGDR